MYIGEIHLEDMFQTNSIEDFYEFYPKEEFQKHFEGIKRLYNEGEYRLLAKQLGALFEPTLNYLVDYGKERPAFLKQLVMDSTPDEWLAHFAVAMILDTQEDCLIVHGDTQVVENLNYFEFHELDDREDMRAYYEFVEFPDTGSRSIGQLHNELKGTFKEKKRWSNIETTLWLWADRFNLSEEVFPRDREGLFALRELRIINQGAITPLNHVSELAEVLQEEKEDLYLPVELFELTELTKLEVWSMSLKYLPDEVEKLENLTELTITINQLEMIPSSVGNLKNLTKLDLSLNWLEEIPITLAKLKNLKYLDVSSENLTITSDQEYWLEELSDDGCEVIWDRENTTVINTEDEYDEEQSTRDLMEMLGGEEALVSALKSMDTKED